MVKHGALVLSADTTEVTQETTAVGHHLGESNLLKRKSKKISSVYCGLCVYSNGAHSNNEVIIKVSSQLPLSHLLHPTH